MIKNTRKIIRNYSNRENKLEEYIKILIDEEIEKCYNKNEVEVTSKKNKGGYLNVN